MLITITIVESCTANSPLLCMYPTPWWRIWPGLIFPWRRGVVRGEYNIEWVTTYGWAPPLCPPPCSMRSDPPPRPPSPPPPRGTLASAARASQKLLRSISMYLQVAGRLATAARASLKLLRTISMCLQVAEQKIIWRTKSLTRMQLEYRKKVQASHVKS